MRVTFCFCRCSFWFHILARLTYDSDFQYPQKCVDVSWKSGKFRIQNKNTASQNWNPCPPNVGKVWISKKKILLAPFGVISGGHFFHGSKKCKTSQKFVCFPWWAHGPYSPGFGPFTNLPGGCRESWKCCDILPADHSESMPIKGLIQKSTL